MNYQVDKILLAKIASRLGADSAWHFGSSSLKGSDTMPNDIDIAFVFSRANPNENDINLIKTNIDDCRVELDKFYTKSRTHKGECKYHIVLVSNKDISLFEGFKVSIRRGYCFWGDENSVH